jgi:BolA protein
MGPVANRMQEQLTASFHPTHLEVVDDSYKHAGHAAMKGKDPVESHFHVKIVSSVFDGMSRIDRHRAVYKALEGIDVHALQITARSPTEGLPQ